jgi:Cu(I)/Ag(I) efflux system membrane fusion protein
MGILLIAGCKSRNTSTGMNTTQKELWTCSMHPEIIRDKPGNCPICGMDLIKKEEHATAIKDIQLNDLLQPTDRFVVSSIPVTSLHSSEELIEFDALGTIAYDTRFVNTISARVSGRIEKLYVKYRYQHVMKGERLMEIYSPELLTTEQELLFILKSDPSNNALINAAEQKLLLLGMSRSQLQEIKSEHKASTTITIFSNYNGHVHEAGSMPATNPDQQKMEVAQTTEELPIKEGMYVEKGQIIFQVFNTDQSWVLLNIFPDYSAIIKPGDAVRIVPETAPTKNFRARINFLEPFFRKENKTQVARIYFDNRQLQLPIGSQVRATIFSRMPTSNWLPKEAVLSLGRDNVAFVKERGGFRAEKIETGLIYENKIQIIGGLTPSDSVASNAQFLADSESFIKANHQP